MNMKYIFKILFFLISASFTVMAQQCVASLKEYEATKDGQVITKCVEKGKNSDLSVCNDTPCLNITLPASLDEKCAGQPDESVLNAFKDTFKQFNEVVNRVCNKITNSTLTENKPSNVTVPIPEVSNSTVTSNDTKTTPVAAGNSTVPVNTTTTTTIKATPTQTKKASSATKLSYSFIAVVVIIINLLF